MIQRLLFLVLFAVALALPGGARGQGDEVSFDWFYEELSPYGEWIETSEYGYCWRPFDVDDGWAPYTEGRWVYTDAGWTWVSDEEFGPITYHYGRWVRLDGLGWIWYPDEEWGPAWVSWRYSDDYVGWAPLPPEVEFHSSVGISVWVDRDYDIGPGYYSFCHVSDFGSPRLSSVIFERGRNITIINQTVNITNITINRSTRWIYNGGPDYRRVSRYSKRRIDTLRLERRPERVRRGHLDRPRREGDLLVVHAPRVRQSDRSRSTPPRVSRRVERARVDKGWSAVRDPAERQRLRTRMDEQTRGMTQRNTPAQTPDRQQFEEAVRSRQASDTPTRRDRRREDEERRRPPTEPFQTPPPASREEATSANRAAERDRRRQQSAEQAQQYPPASTAPDRRRQESQRQQQEAVQRQQQQQRQQQEAVQRQQQQQRQQQEAVQRQQQQQRQQQETIQRQQQQQRQQQEAVQRQQQQQRQQQEAVQRQQQEAVQRQQQQQRQQQEVQQRRERDTQRQQQQAERSRQQQEQHRQQQREQIERNAAERQQMRQDRRQQQRQQNNPYGQPPAGY